jgi:uncharacterized cupin superfamily protein
MGGFEPLKRSEDEGTDVWSFGALMRFNAIGEETGGAFALVDHIAAPGVSSPVHIHRSEEELFYLLDGSIECYLGG